jgi:hypothetical protein
MHWGFRARSVAVGGIFLMVTSVMGTLIEPAYAQAQTVNGFNPYDPQWAFANPAMPFGFNGGSGGAAGITQPAPFGSGTMGLFVASNAPDNGARAIGSSGNFFDPLPFASTLPRQDWFASLGDPAWRTSFVGSYKSAPNPDLLGGLYTTASFGVTTFQTNPSGLPGLTNFTAGNGITATTASAGLGLQLTPQINIEGSVSFTQGPVSNFR